MANESMNPITVQKHLHGVDYPASKEDLIKTAEAQNAPQEVIDMLQRLPDVEYETPADLMKEAGAQE